MKYHIEYLNADLEQVFSSAIICDSVKDAIAKAETFTSENCILNEFQIVTDDGVVVYQSWKSSVL